MFKALSMLSVITKSSITQRLPNKRVVKTTRKAMVEPPGTTAVVTHYISRVPFSIYSNFSHISVS